MIRPLAALLLFGIGAGVGWAQALDYEKHTNHTNAVAFSPDGKILVVAMGFNQATRTKGVVALHDFKTGKLQFTLKHGDSPVNIVFSPDGSLLASAGYRTIRLWNPQNGELIREFVVLEKDFVHGLAFSPDGKVLASGQSGSAVRLWNPADGKEIKSLGKLSPRGGCTFVLAFSPNGNLLVGGGYSEASETNKEAVKAEAPGAKIWDVVEQKELRIIGPTNVKATQLGPLGPPPVYRVAFVGNDKVLTMTDTDLFLWDAQTGKLLRRMKTGGTFASAALAVSKDAKRAATGSDKGDLMLWDLETGKQLFNTRLQPASIRCLAFTPDEKAVVTGHLSEPTVRVTPLTEK